MMPNMPMMKRGGLMDSEDPMETQAEGGIEEPGETGGGLMDRGAEEGREGPSPPPEDSEGPDTHEIDSNLVYEAAMKALNTPEGKKNVVKAVRGATDIGTAVGKMAGVLVTKIASELDARQMGISEESIFGAGGALAKVLTAIYQVANENGAEVQMEDSLIQAYQTAEADLSQVFSGGAQ